MAKPVYQVFVSHGWERTDVENVLKKFIEALESSLEALPESYRDLFSIRLWIDYDDMGGRKEFEARAARECARSAFALFITSNKFFNSENCAFERSFFEQRKQEQDSDPYLLVQLLGDPSENDRNYRGRANYPKQWRPEYKNLLDLYSKGVTSDEDDFVSLIRNEICAHLKQYGGPEWTETGRQSTGTDTGPEGHKSITEISKSVPLAGRTRVTGPFEAFRKIYDNAREKKRSIPTFIVGPKSELVDDFVRTLDLFLSQRRQSPGALTKIGEKDPIVYELVSGSHDTTLREQLLSDLSQKIGKQPGDPPSEKPGSLEYVVSGFSRWLPPRDPVLCLCRKFELEPYKNKGREYLETLLAWKTAWAEISESLPNHILLPILPVVMVGAKPGWQNLGDYPPVEEERTGILSLLKRAQSSCVNTDCHAKLLSAVSGAGTGAKMIPVLEPIRYEPTRDWVDDMGLSEAYGDLEKSIENLFDNNNRGPESGGINMERMHKLVESFQSDGR